MANAGEELYNPRQKDKIVFRRTARETGGRLIRLEMFASAQGAAPAEHVHPPQEQRFQTLSGVLSARVGGPERTLGAEEGMVVPPGTPHTWWIEGAEDAHVLVEFRPALNTEAFFETMYGLARDGKLGESGAPPCCRRRSSPAPTRSTCPDHPWHCRRRSSRSSSPWAS